MDALTLDSLPVDVLLAVACFLSAHDLMHSLGPVCRLLYAVAQNDTVWASIVVSPCCFEELRLWGSKHPSIRYVSVNEYTKINDRRSIKYEDVRNLTNLKDLYDEDEDPDCDWPVEHGVPLHCAYYPNQALGAAASLVALHLVWIIDEPVFFQLSQLCTRVRVLQLNYELPLTMEAAAGFPSVVSFTANSFCSDDVWRVFAECHPALTELSLPSSVGGSTSPTFPLLKRLFYSSVNYAEALIRDAPNLVDAQFLDVPHPVAQALCSAKNIRKLDVVSSTWTPGVQSVIEEATETQNWNFYEYSGPYFNCVSCFDYLAIVSGTIVCDAFLVSMGDRLRNIREMWCESTLSAEGASAIARHVTALRELHIEFEEDTLSPEVDALLATACSTVAVLRVGAACTAIPSTAASNGVLREFYHTAECTVALEAFVRAWKPEMFLCTLSVLRIYHRQSSSRIAELVTEFINKGGTAHHINGNDSLLKKTLTCRKR